jgi:glycosyltransferase involved in cell wall biosynthesis
MDEKTSAQAEGDRKLPSVSIVIPTYNRVAGIAEVVSPLLEDPLPREIVVVVDGCRDGSIEVLSELATRDPRLKPLWISNSGEMGAREAGVREASAEVVLMLDDDVHAGPGLARAHAELHRERERLVVLGYMPTALPPGPPAGSFTTFLYAQEYESACGRYEEDPKRILFHLWAGNVSMRREDALAVGLATDNYASRYHQDREFGLRCQKAGLVGVFDRRLFAQHVHSRSLEAYRRDAQAEGLGRRFLHELHGDLIGPLSEDEFEQGLSSPLRALVRASDNEAVYRLTGSALEAVIAASRRLRAFSVEVKAAKLLRRVEQRRGSRAPA